MKKCTKILLLIVSIAFIGSEAFATNGMRMIGFGPAQRSMGGTSAAVNADAATILTNPAGISAMEARVDFGVSYFQPIVNLEVERDPAYGGSVSKFDSDKGASPIPAFGLIIPINEKINFGLGAYGTAGMGVDCNTYSMGSIINTDYSQMRFSPGLSYKISEMITLGLTANLMYATMEFSMQGSANMKSSALGGGATLGIQITPIKILTIGIAYETESYFQDFKYNTAQAAPNDEMTMEFNQPMNATIGFSVSPDDKLKIAADVQWIKWSDTNDLVEGKVNGNVAMPMDMKWGNQLIYKFGVEYKAIDILKVRAGFNYGETPLNEDQYSENMAFPAVSELHLTGGVEIALNDRTSVSLGGVYSPESEIVKKGAVLDPSSGATGTVTSKMSQYSIDAGITYKFAATK